ncbi:MAG: prepilin peptidase [Oscillospiraceae bacterium]|nr:prepilin peptidase [Oscillospiraceae bacterium]
MGWTILCAAAGALAGAFLPDFADAVCRCKFRRKNKELAPDGRFMSPWLRVLCAALCAAGWGFFACRAPSGGIAAALLAGLIWFVSVAVAVIDVRVHLIPNELLLVIAAAGAALQVLLGGFAALLPALACMAVLMAFFVMCAKMLGGLWYVGAGDVKLAGALGLALGYPAVLCGAMCMALTMLAFCGIGLLAKKLKKTAMIPMAPFLSLGLLAGLVYLFLL